MDRNVLVSIELTAYTKAQLEKSSAEFFAQGWRPYTGIIHESFVTNDESGTNKVSFTITLVKYDD